MKNIFLLLGILCFVFGIIDFAGMFFKYDLTGSSYTPLAAGLVGSFLIKLGDSSSSDGNTHSK